MSALIYERVHDNLNRLKLTTFEALLDNYLEIAAKEERSTLEVLDYLLDQEVKSKEERALSSGCGWPRFRWRSASMILMSVFNPRSIRR
jgi:DNA replication protein DnaC